MPLEKNTCCINFTLKLIPFQEVVNLNSTNSIKCYWFLPMSRTLLTKGEAIIFKIKKNGIFSFLFILINTNKIGTLLEDLNILLYRVVVDCFLIILECSQHDHIKDEVF